MRRNIQRRADRDPPHEGEERLATGPRGLSARTFAVGDDEFVVFSFPLAEAALPAHLAQSLTRAEKEVALLVLEGASNAEISRRRGRSLNTVINQVSSIYRKLGVTSRQELASLSAG
jgi:DNA-binding CsgD family transcriptional regulator